MLLPFLQDSCFKTANQDILLYANGSCCGDCTSSISTNSEALLSGPCNAANNCSQLCHCLPRLQGDMYTTDTDACLISEEAHPDAIAHVTQALSVGVGSCSSVAASPVGCAGAGTGIAGQISLTPALSTQQQQQHAAMPGLDEVIEAVEDATLHGSSTGAAIPTGLAESLSNASSNEVVEASGDSAQGSCSVFFARVPPTVSYNSIKALFEQFGKVKLLNLFRPWASAKTSKVGCLQAAQ
jgi:hypothetical protein